MKEYKESTYITCVGMKNGKKLRIDWDHGQIVCDSIDNFMRLTEILHKPVDAGNCEITQNSALKAKLAFYKFFDEVLSIRYNFDDPSDEFDENVLY